MSAPTGNRSVYALEDCEVLLGNEQRSPLSTDQILVDVELFEALVDLARRARAWGA